MTDTERREEAARGYPREVHHCGGCGVLLPLRGVFCSPAHMYATEEYRRGMDPPRTA